MRFEWDPAKAATNLRDHLVSFEDVIGVFSDDRRIEMIDDRKDYGEERWKTIGFCNYTLLSVVYTLRGEDHNIYRLISARKASPHEQRQWQHRDLHI